MERYNAQPRASDVTYTGLGDYEFDRPAPQAQPKRLQRISRSNHSSNSNVSQQQQQQQPLQPSQPQQQQQQQHYNRPASQNSYNKSTYSPQQRANTISRQYIQRDNQRQFPQLQQQQQHATSGYARPPYPYDEPTSPSAQSDLGPMSHMASQAPVYPRAQSIGGARPGVYASQHHNPQVTSSTPALAMPYPSAMVVGGGMPASSRIVPSQALVNAVASTEINRFQRERDLANALGRRRPTHGSVSSSGSSDYVLGNAVGGGGAASGAEKPFNANAQADTGVSYPAPNAPTVSGAQGRYRAHPQNQQHQHQQFQHQQFQQQQFQQPGPNMHTSVDMRVGRSVSSASAHANGYRGPYGTTGPAFGTQRRGPLPLGMGGAPDAYGRQDRLRKQASAMTITSTGSGMSAADGGNRYANNGPPAANDGVPDKYRTGSNGNNAAAAAAAAAMRNHHAHPGSRSAPDLHMDAMKVAINSVANNLDRNPVPQLPSAYATPVPSAPSAQLPPAPHQQLPAQQQQQQQQPIQQQSVQQQPVQQPLQHTPSQGSARPSSASTRPSVRREAVPVNTELAVLLETVRPVYPAMLSLVAESFCAIISQIARTHERDGLEHPNSFTGRDAVDTIHAIIKAADRNLAVVVGRALEQQALFHDVAYERRLRDDAHELYALDDDMAAALLLRRRQQQQAQAQTPAGDSERDGDGDADADGDGESTLNQDDAGSRTEQPARMPVSGVFVMLTDCYSPTCTSTQPCYSVTCPRQRAQQDHLRKTARSNVAGEMKQEKLWSMSVPTEVVKSVSRRELDRQERLYEVFYGEKDYVRDLCILRDLYMKPLHNGDVVREDRRKNFITKVFKNALAILAENMELHKALERRQKEDFVCHQVGDVFLPFVQHLEAYLEYCANQPYSMHFLEAEKRTNARLVEFLEKTDRRPECRKLGVQHFLTRPPTRLARYPLVLKAVLKYTPEGHPDRETIPHVIARIEAMLGQINAETGRAQNRLRLFKVDDKLECSVADRNNLRLTDEQRRLVRDSPLRKRGGSEASAIQVLLLDHMLLMCKVKTDAQTGDEKYTIYKHPIPLQLLAVSNPDAPAGSVRAASGSGSGSGSTPAAAAAASDEAAAPRPTIIPIDAGDAQRDRHAFPLQLTHLGRNGFTVTLYAGKLADRQQWRQCIEEQQTELAARHRKFELVAVAAQFPSGIRVTSADVYDQGRGVVIGTDRGLYVGVAGRPRSFQLLAHLRHDRVHQIEIHERLGVLAMVADKDRNLYVYPLDQLLVSAGGSGGSSGRVRAKPLHTHVSFVRFGKYQDMDILCSVRSTTLSNQTIIRVFRPADAPQRPRALGRFLALGGADGADAWRCIKECYIAAESTSLHFLRSRLCVGCSRGFEIVDLATMNTQSLLDPADASLGFINRRETSHPIALFRVHDGEFLLCYDVFAFYVNRNGQRARPNWMVHWVGAPVSFKFEYPYVLAFDAQFIEVRHVETAALVQVIVAGACTSLSPAKDGVNLCVTSPAPSLPQEIMRVQHILAKDPL